MVKDLSFETVKHANGYMEYTNQYMKIIEYSRCRRLDSLQDAAIEIDLIDVY